MFFIGKSYSSWQLGECCFGLFPNPIMNNHAIRLCSMRYAKKDNLDRNQLRRGQKPFIMRFIHYSTIHYRIFNCISKSILIKAFDVPTRQALKSDEQRGTREEYYYEIVGERAVIVIEWANREIRLGTLSSRNTLSNVSIDDSGIQI